MPGKISMPSAIAAAPARLVVTRRIRLISLMAALAIAAFAFTAASGAATSTQTVVLSGWRESPEATAALQNVIAAFEASHPTIHVDYKPSDNYVQDIENGFAAGNPPDVFYVNSDVAPDWIARGYLQPLRGFVQKSGFRHEPLPPGSAQRVQGARWTAVRFPVSASRSWRRRPGK
jgi:ABC-type glycerol-3-phosphate transport system substrate-binding protein